MSESAIREKIDELVNDGDVRACLLELLEFERGSSGSATYMAEYKAILQRCSLARGGSVDEA